jgi:hypothetical protein
MPEQTSDLPYDEDLNSEPDVKAAPQQKSFY